MGWSYPHNTFFWIENYYLLTWNLARIRIKKFLEKQNNFLNMTWLFLPRSSCISIFCRKRSCHLFSVTRLQTLVLFFLCFSAFCELQCLFYKNFCLNIYYRNILLHFGLEQVNIYEINKKHSFFKHTSNKFAIRNTSSRAITISFSQNSQWK